MSSLKDKRSSKTELVSLIRPQASEMRPPEVVIGRIAGIGTDGEPIVDFPANPAGVPVPALATARYDDASVGRAVALMFISGDTSRPLVMGLVAHTAESDAVAASGAVQDEVDPPERLILAAAREIVLECGRASIVLTRAGKVLLRGAYISSRSSGMQRISGASVNIN
jgi:hypothetical protein